MSEYSTLPSRLSNNFPFLSHYMCRSFA